ncbi:MAG: hypothetical protein ACOX4L_04160 [Bacillota bacterium]|jgi:hypothetical protein
MVLLSYESLSNLVGLSLLVYLIVQYTKNYIPDRIPTDIYAIFVGTGVIIISQVAQGTSLRDWSMYLFSLFNGFFAAVLAGKIKDIALRPRKRGKNNCV